MRGTTCKGTLAGKPGPALLGLGSIEPGGGFREGHYKTYGGDCPSKLMLFPGDLYVALKGATKDGSMVGSVAHVPKTIPSGRLTQDTVKLEFRNPNPHEVAYLYWLLRTPQYRAYCTNRVTGSAVAALSREDFLAYLVPPLTDTRRQLVDLFDFLEDKIELNQQMNHTLEAIARALFKSWFIDFDPVRAKLDGRQPAGLDAETAALFPDGFEDSAIGQIPKGWEVIKLGKVIDILNGYAFKSQDYTDAGIFVLRTKNFSDDGYAEHLDDDVFLPSALVEIYSKYLCQPFDFHLVMVGASVGKTSLLLPHLLPALRNQNMWCFRPKAQGLNIRFFINSLLPYIVNEMLSWASGSAREFFRKSDFQEIQIKLPNRNLLIRHEEFATPIFEKIASNALDNEQLISIRNVLLPKLLSGEIQIKDAEKVVEAVA